ncbi:hypothetical protein E5288_WYG022771 [Bos mutus]|uniref:MARVEL domain-containing protein n=1 Tax=Bos mutus TaxID=72004 RepID=A0A6B0QXY9_9CETA|nr:hypothetical protein [Bos mutus]
MFTRGILPDLVYVETLYSLFSLVQMISIYVTLFLAARMDNERGAPALKCCLAVYFTCFVRVAVAMLLKLSGWENRLPLRLPIFHLGQTMLSFLLYVSAMVLWPLYQFDEKLGGQPHWYSDMSCVDELTDYGCVWDQRLAVANLTAINLLMYVVDLVYWTCQFSEELTSCPHEPRGLDSEPLRVSSLTPSEKGTQVESSCLKWRKKPMMGLVPRPEDGHMVIMVVRQLFSSCVAFSLVADMGIWRGATGNWSMSLWCICFIVTLIIPTVDLRELSSCFPFFWCNTTLLCLSASIIYCVTFVQFLPDGPYWHQAISATTFPCVASVLHAL